VAALLAASAGSAVAAQPKKLRLSKGVAKLQREATDRWPGSYGGAWLERGKIFVAFTGRSKRRAGILREDFPSPGKLRSRTVGRSLAGLRSFQATAIAARELSTPDEVPYDLDIDVQANSVVAIVEDPNPVTVAFLTARHGAELEIRKGDLALPEACTSRTFCTPDLRSGLQVSQTSGALCSTAFTVRSRLGFDGILSAAHCGKDDVGSSRFHTNVFTGSVVAEQHFGNVDAELHRDLSSTLSMSKPLIYANEQQRNRLVLRSGSYAGLLKGFYVCKAGWVTDETCGKVESTDYAPDSTSYSHQFIKARYCANPGDSGSGVYQRINIHGKPKAPRAAALGIHSAGASRLVNGEKIPRVCPDPLDYGVFGHIEFAKKAFNLAVHQQPLP